MGANDGVFRGDETQIRWVWELEVNFSELVVVNISQVQVGGNGFMGDEFSIFCDHG